MQIRRTQIYRDSDTFRLYENTDDDDNDYVSTITACLNEKKDWVHDMLGYKDTEIVFLASFSTNENKRGKGYGRILLRYVKNYYKNCFLMLEVNSSGEMTNKQLKEFYESEGFNEIIPPEEKKKNEYTMIIKI